MKHTTLMVTASIFAAAITAAALTASGNAGVSSATPNAMSSAIATQIADCGALAVESENPVLWDARRTAQETGLGITPRPFRSSHTDSLVTATTSQQNCRSEALSQTPEVQLESAHRQIASNASDEDKRRYRSLDDYLLAQPEVRQALKGWSRCMANKGHSFSSPGDMSAYLERQVAALGDLPDMPLTNEPPLTEEDQQLFDFWQDLEPTLETMRSVETEIVTASVDCGRTTTIPAVVALAGDR